MKFRDFLSAYHSYVYVTLINYSDLSIIEHMTVGDILNRIDEYETYTIKYFSVTMADGITILYITNQ